MASIKHVKTDKDEYWLIQVSRGRGRSPVSQRWRPPPATRWSQATKEKKVQAYAAELEKQVKTGTFKTKKQLKEEQERLEAELAAQPTFEQFCRDTFLPKIQAEVADNTIYRYGKTLERHFYPVLGDKHLGSITANDVQSIVDDTFGTLRRGTAIEYTTLLHRALTYAYKLDFLKTDLWVKVDIPKEKKDDRVHRMQDREKRTLSIEESRSVLDYARNEKPFWRAVLELLSDTGMRVGELCGLQWGDLDVDAKRINIQRILRRNYKRKCYEIAPPKTASSIRSVDIGDSTLDALLELREKQKESGYSPEGEAWIFPGQGGWPIRIGTVGGHVSDFAKKYNLRHLFPHQFRHAVVSRSLDGGASLIGTARRMGHSSTNTTLAVYAHATEDAAVTAGQIARQRLQETPDSPES